MAESRIYTVQLQPAEEGGFAVTVPALPGCFTHGETYEEALEMGVRGNRVLSRIPRQAWRCEPIPIEETEQDPLTARVRVSAPVEA